METQGLIIGLDIQENNSQACFYNWKNKTMQTVIFSDNKSVFMHPDALHYLYDSAKNGEPVNLDKLSGHIAFLLDSVRQLAGIRTIEKLCITVSDYNLVILDAIRAVMNQLQIPEDRWILISHEESYAYYVYSQGKELYRGGVMLLDYQADGLHAYYMTNVVSGGQEYILEQPHFYEDEDLKQLITKEKTFVQIQDTIIAHLNELIGQKVISSIYLTGPGFENQEFPESFAQVICRRRKAFAGQNLFVKGACICAYEEIMPDRFKDVILACANRVTTGIEADILERGKNKRLRIIRPGTNWYMASRSMDFILEDIRQIHFIMRPCDQKQDYEEVIDISDFPYREGKMTRINLQIDFVADNRCMVTIRDLGFGDFAESSGKVIHKEMTL